MSGKEGGENGNSSAFKKYQTQCILQIGEKLYLDSKILHLHRLMVKSHAFHLTNVYCLQSAKYSIECFMGNRKNLVTSSEAAFMEFLQFFHLSKVKLTNDNIAGVMLPGRKYDVAKCLEICAEYLKDVLTIDNICSGLKLAIQYDQRRFLIVKHLFL